MYVASARCGAGKRSGHGAGYSAASAGLCHARGRLAREDGGGSAIRTPPSIACVCLACWRFDSHEKTGTDEKALRMDKKLFAKDKRITLMSH